MIECVRLIQAQRRARVHQIRLEAGAKKAAEELEKCDWLSLYIYIIVCYFYMLPSFLVYLCFITINFADDPSNDPNVSGDPYKTLFVARLVSIIIIINYLQNFWWFFKLLILLYAFYISRTTRQLKAESKGSLRLMVQLNR